MKKPKISVLLCAYNPDKKQLQQAVESIVEQSFGDWEMILYDDGSDSAYIESISQIAAMDQRICYIRNSNHHSLAYGLNESMKRAKGEYLARMDADDISHPMRFEKQYTFLEEHDEYMWVGSNISTMDNAGYIWGERHYSAVPSGKEFLDYSPYAHPSVMIRKEALLRYGGYRIEKNPNRAEDYELFMRLHAAGERGFNIQENLLDYRESLEGYKKRTLYYYIQEMLVRFEGFRSLGILKPGTFIYVLKPLAVWLLPNRWIYAIKRG